MYEDGWIFRSSICYGIDERLSTRGQWKKVWFKDVKYGEYFASEKGGGVLLAKVLSPAYGSRINTDAALMWKDGDPRSDKLSTCLYVDTGDIARAKVWVFRDVATGIPLFVVESFSQMHDELFWVWNKDKAVDDMAIPNLIAEIIKEKE